MSEAVEEIKSPETQDASKNVLDPDKLSLLGDFTVNVTVEVGRTKMKIMDLMNLAKGSVIELDKMVGDPADVYLNGKLIAKGLIISANNRYALKISQVIVGSS